MHYCGNLKLSISGNFKCPKNMSAESFELFSCLLMTSYVLLCDLLSPPQLTAWRILQDFQTFWSLTSFLTYLLTLAISRGAFDPKNAMGGPKRRLYFFIPMSRLQSIISSIILCLSPEIPRKEFFRLNAFNLRKKIKTKKRLGLFLPNL